MTFQADDYLRSIEIERSASFQLPSFVSRSVLKKYLHNIEHIILFAFFQLGDDTDADEDEGHISHECEKDINKDKDRIEDDTLCDDQSSPEQPNGEISVSLLRAKNLSLLQSQ